VEPLLRAKLNAEILGYLIESSLKVISATGVAPRVRLIAEILRDCDVVEEGIIVALAVAYASNGISAPERELVGSIAQAARLDDERFKALDAEVAAAFESRASSASISG
jgi:hypothetical protein